MIGQGLQLRVALPMYEVGHDTRIRHIGVESRPVTYRMRGRQRVGSNEPLTKRHVVLGV